MESDLQYQKCCCFELVAALGLQMGLQFLLLLNFPAVEILQLLLITTQIFAGAHRYVCELLA